VAEHEQQGSGAATDPGRVAELLDAVVAQVDAGELEATSPERAYLRGAAQALRTLAAGGAAGSS